MLYLTPIFEVWRKQGYVTLPDGRTRRRLWEPDPLDVCFCGGPRRFAECCKEEVDRKALNQHARRAATASDLAAVEKYARADLAQYVIWVRQHTAPTMNSAPGLHREFADMDVLALEGFVKEVWRSQNANGTEDAFVAQMRQLARTIGVPKISVRLIALASEWFFRAGRIEEGILELDSLGNLRQVEDALALTIAARFCDLDNRAGEETLRRAASVALCKEERWAAELALAKRLLRRNAKQEALKLADKIYAEASEPDGFAGAVAEASLLRWRITRAQNDFESAMVLSAETPTVVAMQAR